MHLTEKEILYCDNHLLVVNKRSNLLTQPDNSNNPSLQELAKEWITKNNKGGVFLHCVHRLDKAVSGIVLFARSKKALSRLNSQIREKKVLKKYVAKVEGKLTTKKGVLENYLTHRDFYSEVVSQNEGQAKLAKLEYCVVHENDDSSVVEINLITGRYHQIRSQFSHIGHPIIGDSKYGGKLKSDKIMLHHCEMEIMHPVKKEKMKFSSKSCFFLSNSTILKNLDYDFSL